MKKLLVISAFAAVFVVKSAPIEAQSLDSPIESVEVFSAETPDILLQSFEIKSDKTVFSFSHSVTRPSIAASVEIVDVGKQVPINMELTTDILITASFDLMKQLQFENFLFIKNDFYGLGGIAVGHSPGQIDSDTPYTSFELFPWIA